MRSFQKELEKNAAGIADLISHLGRRGLRHNVQAGLGTGLGLGALGGATLGGAAQAYQGYNAAREAGLGTGSSLLYGLSGGAAGALQGAAVGGASGGLAGGLMSAYLTGAYGPRQVLRAHRYLAGRKGVIGAATRFGQRQVHGFTGWRPGGSRHSLEKIRGGAYSARSGLARAAQQDNPRALATALQQFKAMEEAQAKGLTSIPGLLAAGVRRPLDTARTVAKSQWQGSSPVEKAFTVGLPAAAVASSLASGDEPGGPGRGENLLRAVGTLGYMTPLPLGASVALGSATESLGGGVGRLIDKLRRARGAEPDQPGDTERATADYVYGPGYTGQVPEMAG